MISNTRDDDLLLRAHWRGTLPPGLVLACFGGDGGDGGGSDGSDSGGYTDAGYTGDYGSMNEMGAAADAQSGFGGAYASGETDNGPGYAGNINSGYADPTYDPQGLYGPPNIGLAQSDNVFDTIGNMANDAIGSIGDSGGWGDPGGYTGGYTDTSAEDMSGWGVYGNNAFDSIANMAQNAIGELNETNGWADAPTVGSIGYSEPTTESLAQIAASPTSEMYGPDFSEFTPNEEAPQSNVNFGAMPSADAFNTESLFDNVNNFDMYQAATAPTATPNIAAAQEAPASDFDLAKEMESYAAQNMQSAPEAVSLAWEPDDKEEGPTSQQFGFNPLSQEYVSNQDFKFEPVSFDESMLNPDFTENPGFVSGPAMGARGNVTGGYDVSTMLGAYTGAPAPDNTMFEGSRAAPTGPMTAGLMSTGREAEDPTLSMLFNPTILDVRKDFSVVDEQELPQSVKDAIAEQSAAMAAANATTSGGAPSGSTTGGSTIGGATGGATGGTGMAGAPGATGATTGGLPGLAGLTGSAPSSSAPTGEQQTSQAAQQAAAQSQQEAAAQSVGQALAALGALGYNAPEGPSAGSPDGGAPNGQSAIGSAIGAVPGRTSTTPIQIPEPVIPPTPTWGQNMQVAQAQSLPPGIQQLLGNTGTAFQGSNITSGPNNATPTVAGQVGQRGSLAAVASAPVEDRPLVNPRARYADMPAPQSEVNWMARALIGESEVSDRTGRAAVGSAISNRANTNFGRYGTTVAEQVQAPSQFSYLNRARDVARVQRAERNNTADWQAAQELARDILEGKVGDPVRGSVMYHNPQVTRGNRASQPHLRTEARGSIDIQADSPLTHHRFSDFQNEFRPGNPQGYFRGEKQEIPLPPARPADPPGPQSSILDRILNAINPISSAQAQEGKFTGRADPNAPRDPQWAPEYRLSPSEPPQQIGVVNRDTRTFGGLPALGEPLATFGRNDVASRPGDAPMSPPNGFSVAGAPPSMIGAPGPNLGAPARTGLAGLPGFQLDGLPEGPVPSGQPGPVAGVPSPAPSTAPDPREMTIKKNHNLPALGDPIEIASAPEPAPETPGPTPQAIREPGAVYGPFQNPNISPWLSIPAGVIVPGLGTVLAARSIANALGAQPDFWNSVDRSNTGDGGVPIHTNAGYVPASGMRLSPSSSYTYTPPTGGTVGGGASNPAWARTYIPPTGPLTRYGIDQGEHNFFTDNRAVA